MSVRLALLALLAIASPMLPADASAAESDEAAAVAAAQRWLTLVDAGEYAESWSEAAAYFRGAVTEAQWTQQVAAVRGPLGALRSRTVASSQAATSLPGAPDGEYVVIQFTTSFAEKASAVETVTPMKDADGVWRVSGYFIR